MTKSWKIRAISATCVFLLLAIYYFLPNNNCEFRTALPVASLFLFSIGMVPWQVCLALLFSMLGDLSACLRPRIGVDLAFIFQMGSFAVAQALYCVYFVKQLKEIPQRRNRFYLAGVAVFSLAVLIFAYLAVVMKVDTPLRYGVMVYMMLILSMMTSALLTKDPFWAAGALLFVFSDTILAWNKFVGPVPGESYFIMVTYYGAQLLIAGRAAFRKVSANSCA